MPGPRRPRQSWSCPRHGGLGPAIRQNLFAICGHCSVESEHIRMKFFDLRCTLGVLAIAFMGCSSSEHQLGENAAGASGASGTGNSAGETGNGGDSGLAGGGHAGLGSGGSSASGSGGADRGGSGSGGAGRGGAGSGGAGRGGASAGGSSGATNSAGSGSAGSAGLEAGCTQSGGTVMNAFCCSPADFPKLCLNGAVGGACTCPPASSHEVKVCNCPSGTCFDGHACVAEM